MRTVHWLFLVSAALFISGIAFVVAAGRTTQQAPPVQAQVDPVATVGQIMRTITGPAATAVFESVGTVLSMDDAGRQKVVETFPRNDAEWQAVGDRAAAIVESGNLLMMGNRAVDAAEWAKISQDMIEAGKIALKAVAAKDADALLFSGEAINDSCDNCHQRYMR
jgi:hypothetical protein